MTKTERDPAAAACRERCIPDPPCYELDRRDGKSWRPCDDCLDEIGEEVIAPIDPDAVLRPLL